MSAADYFWLALICVAFPFALSASAGSVAYFRGRRKLGLALIAGGIAFTLSFSFVIIWWLFAGLDDCNKQPADTGNDCDKPGALVWPFVPLFVSAPTFVGTWLVYVLRGSFTQRSSNTRDVV